jgi:hypothetical protein
VWCWGASGTDGSALLPVLVFGSGTLSGSMLLSIGSIVAGYRHHCVVATFSISTCNEADSAQCRASGGNASLFSAGAVASQRTVDSVW